ncbi:restriction endonuclease subunit S [Dietzia maris]|uniref:restriction endonuclease subunit S n=1 Tax=Dietzia maris TaxID=37915 RepID=UPI0034426227
MMLNLDKSTWQRVKIGDVVNASKEKVDPSSGDVERYIAGEHMDSDDLKIHRWGKVGDKDLGPAFHRRFRPGQVLYGSRRTYLRKVSVADFDGVCANTTFVLETADGNRLLQEFLPLVMTSESFHAYAIGESKGSVNPYVNWSDIARFEFDLPPLVEQKRIADLLWTVEQDSRASHDLFSSLARVRSAQINDAISRITDRHSTSSLDSLIEKGRPITYGILKPGIGQEDGVPVVKVRDYPAGEIQTHNLLRTTEEISNNYKRSLLKEGDLLISIRGTVGRMARVPAELEGANITQDTARLSIDKRHDSNYVRLVLESDYGQNQIRRSMTGLAVKGINIGELRKISIPIPENAEDKSSFVQSVGTIDDAMRNVSQRLDSEKGITTALLSSIFGDS